MSIKHPFQVYLAAVQDTQQCQLDDYTCREREANEECSSMWVLLTESKVVNAVGRRRLQMVGVPIDLRVWDLRCFVSYSRLIISARG